MNRIVSRVAPAARRAFSSATSAPGGANSTSFNDTWGALEAVPLVVMVTIPSCFAIYTVSKFASTHNECQWSKTTKTKGVSAWYESKYPGTKPTNNGGARYSSHHH
eukprot:CAMPEP_0113676072 /NCGR_PEP_ID=MMETSP0038_2-20120614/8427_1 /TAXON_ID=2898 /ORGANISM="Cryptomonas paramecium" /LENGTH=105 /DNA_ID=CAMNT_0000593035 /DNA_START=52 /DNA_END=369 /DNA_ORIENTATION=+ /assembly_acc=CAM_ASM_000170